MGVRRYPVRMPDAYDWLIDDLGLVERAPVFVDEASGATVRLALLQDGDEVVIEEILCEPKGTGLGSRVVESLQDYASANDAYLSVARPENEAFWAKWSIPTYE